MKKIGMVLVALFLILPVFMIPNANAPLVARVVIYYGNGGLGPADEPGRLTDYYSLKALYDARGLPAAYTDVWPNLSEFSLIIMVAPGWDDDSGTNFFSASQVLALKLFLRFGGHLVILGERGGATDNTVNDLLGRLGVGIRQNSDVAHGDGDALPPIPRIPWISNDRLTSGVTSLDLAASSSLTLFGRAKSLVRTPHSTPPGKTVIAVDRSLFGFVLVSGDANFLDDRFLLDDPQGDGVGDWDRFAMNLLLYS